MTTRIGLLRITVILLFIIAFTVVGWAAPAFYATHAPQEQFIEVHKFEAQNTTTNAPTHYICFDRTAKSSTTGRVFTELYLVDGNDQMRTEVASQTMDRYFQEGHQEVVTPQPLPEALTAGEYRYLLVIQMELSDGRVTRDFAFTSDPFTISDPENSTSGGLKELGC